MTACWCRLTQPENSSRKKASGGGTWTMAGVSLTGGRRSTGARLDILRRHAGLEFPRRRRFAPASTSHPPKRSRTAGNWPGDPVLAKVRLLICESAPLSTDHRTCKACGSYNRDFRSNQCVFGMYLQVRAKRDVAPHTGLILVHAHRDLVVSAHSPSIAGHAEDCPSCGKRSRESSFPRWTYSGNMAIRSARYTRARDTRTMRSDQKESLTNAGSLARIVVIVGASIFFWCRHLRHRACGTSDARSWYSEG